MDQNTEASLLQKMAAANSLEEQEAYASELESLRQARRRKADDEAESMWAQSHLETYAPLGSVLSSRTPTTIGTEWLDGIDVPSIPVGEVEAKMRAEASMWWTRTPDFVKEDAHESGVQAMGLARRTASQFGTAADKGVAAFIDQIQHLAEVGDHPKPHVPGEHIGEDEQTSASDTPSLSEGTEPEGDGTASAPVGASQVQNLDAATWPAQTEQEWKDGQEYPGKSASRKTALSVGDKVTVDGKTVTVKEVLSGGLVSVEDEHGSLWTEQEKDATKTSSRKTAISLSNVGIDGPGVGIGTDPSGKRVKFNLSAEDEKSLKAILYSDMAINFSGVDIEESDLVKEGYRLTSRRTASEGQTCATCGDKIAKDPEGGGGYHHDNGEKHDHEAKPESSKESSRKTASGEKIADFDPNVSGYTRQMAAGHQMRLGHPLVGYYETTDAEGISKFVRTCCGEDKQASRKHAAQGDAEIIAWAFDEAGVEDSRIDALVTEFMAQDSGSADGLWTRAQEWVKGRTASRKTARDDTVALDVWFKFDSPDDEETSHEANIYTDGDGYRIEWYNTSVGLVTEIHTDTYEEAAAILTRDGYQDFSSGDGHFASRRKQSSRNPLRGLASKIQVGAQDVPALKAMASLKSVDDTVQGLTGRQIIAHVLATGQMDEQTRHALTRVASRKEAAQSEETRPLHVIADQIRADWENPYFGAVPYLDVMSVLESPDDTYGSDTGRKVAGYFLANSETWRGKTASKVKDELRRIAQSGNQS